MFSREPLNMVDLNGSEVHPFAYLANQLSSVSAIIIHTIVQFKNL